MAERKPKKSKYRFVSRFLIKTGVIALAAAGVLVFFLQAYRMDGNQMFPSVRDGDLCFFYKLGTCTADDIVLYEDRNGELRAGRVIAVGGQTVDFPESGGYTVNGCEILDEIPYETYAAESGSVDYPVTLEEGQYFILNDFRPDTADSREYGPVDGTRIKGKLLFLLRRRGF